MEKGKILIIDDIEANLNFVEDVLSDAGYDVLLANNGEDGFASAEKNNPDVVLLDIMMPGTSGLEICKRIRQSNSSLASIKVIMLSASDGSGAVIEGLEAGADDYLAKPYKAGELLARVKAQYKTKKVEDALKTSLSQSEYLSAIGNMAASIAHDFNNVLTEIQLIFYLIRMQVEKGEVAFCEGKIEDTENFIKSIIESCETGHKGLQFGRTLMKGLKTFACDSHAEQEVQLLQPILEMPVDLLNRKIQQENITVNIEVESENIQVKCNAGEIQQVVLNLVTNALYSMKGLPEKYLTLRLWKNDKYACFSVADTGKGILDEIQPNIFDDFYTTKPSRKGTGIGLSSVKKIVDAHKGEVEFISEVDKGSTFSISLPLYKKSAIKEEV